MDGWCIDPITDPCIDPNLYIDNKKGELPFCTPKTIKRRHAGIFISLWTNGMHMHMRLAITNNKVWEDSSSLGKVCADITVESGLAGCVLTVVETVECPLLLFPPLCAKHH